MKFKYLEFVNKDNQSIIIGRNDSNKESTLQLMKVGGLTKDSTKIFSNEVIDSVKRVFRGNRLSARQVEVKFVYQPKSFLGNSTDEWKNKEEFLVSLISFFETTSIQDEDDLGRLILTSRNNNKYVIDGIIVKSIEEVSDSKAYNNYIELVMTIQSNSPYIKSGEAKTETFDLSASTVLTDFVYDPLIGSTALEYELESKIETGEEEVDEVRDGYISNDGIFYAVDSYGEDINQTYNGHFWLTNSLIKSVANVGSRVYPIFKIYGYVVNPRIVNETTNQVFELDYTINENEYVLVDMEKKTCTLYYEANGLEQTLDIEDFITGESSWIYLLKGENEIGVSFDAGAQDQFRIEMEWDTLLEGIAI